mgnify:FL=1|tara:strand:- start:1846 stop:3240 length:1395 start_codon:yes stop_codon:yes gene_type:complete
MAVNIPIISEFDGTGISKAIKEFKQLETNGQKAQFAIKKAAVPAGLAIAGLAVALGDAAKGAMEDEAAQQLLATTIQKATGATDAQIKANEDWISTQGKLLGVTDDELRPVMGRLVKATGDVTKAQELASQAMDIAASTGKPLATVTASLEKAYGGNLTALAKLAPEYRQMIKDGATFEEVMAAIGTTTGGAATTAAESAQGQFKRLGVALAETKESIGAALLPAIEAVLPFLSAMAKWAQDNSTVFVIIAGVIGAIAAAVVIANAAITAWGVATKVFTGIQTAFNIVMAANPVVLLAVAIAALVVGLVIAYKKFDAFREIVDAVFGAIKTGIKGGMDAITGYLTFVMGVYKGIFNAIGSLWNSTIGKLSFTVPSWVPGLGGKGFDVPDIPMLANGGIVNSATLAIIGEKGPEAVVPLSKMGDMGGGTNITINVNGGDPNAVVQALRNYMRQNGSIPIKTANLY